VPAGFARIDSDNALIRFFKEGKDKDIFGQNAILIDEVKNKLRKRISPELKQLLKDVLYQMEIFESVACIPNYFQDELMGVVLLGVKKGGKKILRKEIDFFLALASDVAMAIRNAQLFKELELELDRKYRLFIHTTVALAAAIDAKDHYTHGHTSRVTNLTLKIAEKLKEGNKKVFSDKFIEHLHVASLLHDIGKIGIPESILNKEGPLNDEEQKKMREHPVIGSIILQPIKELEDAIMGVKYHHEKFDGTGYPDGLKGDQIPLVASLISVADAFDAMTTDRPYRKALTYQQAIEEIKKGKGKQFDPVMADAFIDLYQEGKI
jgi:HD-GYP domain-containing protein (c-di-GMP phosphodiesterase class II)